MHKLLFMSYWLASFILVFACLPASAAPLIFAAASLGGPLEEALEGSPCANARISYAGSAALARQISFGAPADLFISANLDWMDWLQDQDSQTFEAVHLLSNELVVIAHGREGHPIDLSQLPAELGPARLSVALVAAVPAGQYAKAGLEHFSIWSDVKDQLAQTDNVRAALALVARGEAPLGIVYATDAKASDAVHVAATFPSESHTQIIYPAAALTETGQTCLQVLQTNQALDIFKKAGFGLPDKR